METEQEDVNSLTSGDIDNGVEENQSSTADVAGPSTVASTSNLAGPSDMAGPSHESSEKIDQNPQETDKQQHADTVDAAEVTSNPVTTDIGKTPSDFVPSLDAVKSLPTMGLIPKPSINFKDSIEDTVLEELPKNIFESSSENESVVSGPPQTSDIEEKPEVSLPNLAPTLDPVPPSLPPTEQKLPPVTPTTTLSNQDVEQRPTPLPTPVVEPKAPSVPSQSVEQKPAPTSHVEHKPPSLPSVSENKYTRISKDVEGVDKRLAEVSDCPNLSLVDKVVITDVTTAKGTITVKECTTDEGFFANNIPPGESKTTNGSSLT